MWTKLSDEFCIHPKILKVGNEAVGVFARMLSYCGRGTDGKVPTEMVMFFANGDLDLLEKLTDVGLIKERGDHWLIVNFLKHNVSRAQWKERQKKDKERKKRERGVREESRRDSARSPRG